MTWTFVCNFGKENIKICVSSFLVGRAGKLFFPPPEKGHLLTCLCYRGCSVLDLNFIVPRLLYLLFITKFILN